MPGTLHLVATPIGNLEDITLRALRVLREVRVIAAEDTRRSSKLLAHYGISTPLLSYHEHNSRARLPQLVERLLSGEDVAVVTDAGTPGISDPGAELVQACVQAGIAVNPVPGVSALLAAAMASGFPLVPLTFFGFAPARSNARLAWLREISRTAGTFCFFEAPTRIEATIGALAEIMVNRQITVAREVTKMHQEFVRGPVNLAKDRIRQPRGEFTVVVAPAGEPSEASHPASDDELAAELGRLMERGGFDRREAIKAIAKSSRRPAREVYAAVERVKDRTRG